MARAAQEGSVEGDALTYRQDGQDRQVAVGSAEWYDWLESNDAFSFADQAGSFTAHKARSGNGRGGWYWRAYRRRAGQLARVYLGKSHDLTPDRLRDAARQLAADAPADSPPVAAPAEPSRADDTLIVTKLSIPQLSVQHVPRPHLRALLDRAVASSALTLVAAPAGSGKTTLLAEWAGSVDRRLRVAWLALESDDDDAARFISYLIAALARLDPRIGMEARASLRAARGDLDRALASLVNDLAAFLSSDAVLILDDYHLITAPAAHRALLFLLDHLPQRLRLLIGSRDDPPLPLARLRARGQLSELRGEDLRFDAAEAATFLRGMGIELAADEVASLEQRTEGWIAGIQLLALALRGHADPAALLRTLAGTHRFIAEYLSEEVLQARPAAQRDFLLRTSVLERLCGPLCDALTGGSDGAAMLVELRRANLFISVLDEAEVWYRYHPLFAAALREQLKRQQPALVAELYRRAGDWYEQQDLVFQATEYALLAGDYTRAADLMEPQARDMVRRGDMASLRRWMNLLPEPVLFAHPHLCLSAVWALLFDGEDERVREVLAQVERYLQEHQHDGASRDWMEIYSELRIFEAVTALPENDTAVAIERASAALASLPDDALYLRNLASLSLAIAMSTAYRARGDIAAAEQVLAQVSMQRPEDYNFLSMIAMHGLAELYQAQGHLHKMARHYEQMLALLPEFDELPPLLIFFVCVDYAGLMYIWNRLAEADSYIERIVRASEQDSGLDEMVTLISLTRVKIYLAQGKQEAAQQILDELLDALDAATVAPPLRANADVLRASVLLATGHPEEPLRWARECGLHPDDQIDELADADVFSQYMVLARVLIEKARLEQSSIGLDAVLLMLDRWRALAAGHGFNGWLIEVLTLRALALDEMGATAQALETLGQALALGEPEGYIRTFADEGLPMRRLLSRLASHPEQAPGVSAAYIQQLLAATAAPPSIAPTARPHHPALVEPLTPREQEVLTLIVRGASNQQIALALTITPNTAKRHVKHILGKLGATNRTQAVARAHELELI